VELPVKGTPEVEHIASILILCVYPIDSRYEMKKSLIELDFVQWEAQSKLVLHLSNDEN